jgi:peroxiredoxin Q/BCP
MAKAKSEVTGPKVKSLQEGDAAPSFTLESDTGEKVSLKDFKGKKVVLYFYPKDMTPGCTQEACDFRDSFARIKKSDAVVLGVSKDSVTSHQKFKTKHDLPFPLLSDSDGKVCELYGVWQEKSLYGKKFMGIVRSTFVIDEKGKILRSFPKVKVNGHVDEILAVLKS